ncbi:hypothetical protein [Nocardia niigatensis]|uniref:hypothetical protein n=1 Tax=Nocardia niigatensis TaxID=209249 RepID=UPI00030290CF|nr:hypothetical protein [Nocardia niigatensis]
MPRDFDPSVREHDAAPPARRGSRRDPVPVDPSYEEPDPYPPPSSRVMRDEHRPRRGTLPDRRMLRRDPIEPAGEDRPAAVVTEPAGDTVPAEREFVADTVAPQRDPASQPVPPVAAQTVEERVTAVTTAEAEPERIEPRAAVPSPEPVEVDVAPQRTETAAAAADVPAAGRDPEPVRTPARRRLPALPALEPAGGTGESATTESAPATAATGLELAVRPAADSGDALRAAAGVLGEPASQPAERSERALDKRSGRSGVASRSGGVREGEAARPRRPERTEGDRMERKRSRETTPDAEAEAARRGEPGERRRERPRADGEPGRERRAEGEPARERRNSDGEAGRERRAADGRERRGDPERDARRANGSEGRGRSTDADRVHLGGRAGTPGRARPARPEGEAGERPVRNRPVRDRRPERAATDERGRGGARKGKRDKITDPAEREAAAKRAAARRAAAKKKQSGPKLLDDTMRAKLEVTAREGNGIKAAWATFRLHTDDLRRRNFAARAERMEYGSFDEFDRTTAQLTDRGYIGAGGGRMNVIGRPVEYRATTAQVAGLWPWSVGAGAPLIGTPLGSHLHTGAPVCFDPMNWFMRGSFITAPSLFVLGLNGFGKSSLVRRIVLGGVAQGITPLVLADVKPDYRKLVELVGGQVIDLGYGHGKLNPLAAGVLGSIVPLLNELPELQTQVMQEMRARQVTLVAGLVELVRGARVRDFEETLISTALRILYREGSGFTPDQPPIIEDLLDVVVAGGDELQLDAGADNPEEYQEAIKGLRRSLRALTQGPFGAVFNGHTTTPIDTNSTAVCVDVSHIPNGDKKLKAAVMLACWADGFASVEAAHVLADADMGPQRYFQVVMDELWQVLGLGDFMVDRVDELTRLQRGIATSLIMISHTIKDLQALGSEAAIAKALGFLERARAKIFGALPAEEIARLDSTVPFTAAEEEMVTSWSAPQALTGEALKPGQQRPPAPGTGKFLLKIGEDRRPGIPFHMEFTLSERESGIHDTNQRFSEFTETTASRGSDEGSAA